MYRTLLLILLTLHMTGDFYLQPHTVAEKKNIRYRYVVLHSLIYATVFFAGLSVLWSLPGFITAAVLSVLHLIIDSLKYQWMKTHGEFADSAVYCADQCLHLLSIATTAVILKFSAVPLHVIPLLSGVQTPVLMDPLTLLQWICLIAIICKPANITIKALTAKYKPAAIDQAKKNAGAFIGILERLLIALLLSAGQYAAIGLVLTAKSVARYEKLKDQTFAEYYLLGTLLSTLLVVAAYTAIFKL